MFAKTATVCGKTVLSGKDSKAFRDQLLQGSIREIALYWNDLASSLKNPVDEKTAAAAAADTIRRVSTLIASWLGVPCSGGCSFIVDVVQGTQKGAAGGENNNNSNTNSNGGGGAESRVWLGLWNTKEGSGSSPPMFLSLLDSSSDRSSGGLNPNRVTLPAQGVDSSYCCLSLFAQMRVAQLWQLVLGAAACLSMAPTRAASATKTTDAGKPEKKKIAEGSSEEEEEEEESESNSTDSSSRSSDDEKEEDNDDEAVISKGGGAIVLRIASLIFSPSLHSSSCSSSSLSLLLRSPLLCSAPATPHCVFVHAEVADRVVRGADVMAAGTFVHRSCAPYLRRVSWCLVAVVPLGHFAPVAIGVLHANFQIPTFVAVRGDTATSSSTTAAASAATEQQQQQQQQLDEDAGEEQQEETEKQLEDNSSEDDEEEEEDDDEKEMDTVASQLFQQQHVQSLIKRGSMSQAETTETRAVRIQTALGDALWKQGEVAQVKSSSFLSMTVFAVRALSAPNSPAVVSILRRILSKAAAPTAAENEDDQQQSSSSSPTTRGKGKQQQQQSGKSLKQQQTKKKQQKQPAIGGKKDKGSSEESVPLQQLRALLQEAQPSAWPAGFTMSSPPSISVDDAAEKCIAPTSFAMSALALLKLASRADGAEPGAPSAPSTAAGSSSSSTSLSSDDIMMAAAFHLLSAITKDQLPLPLSQFGSLLQSSLQQQATSSAIADWAATRWKRPIVFLREIAKPSKHAPSSSGKKAAAEASSAAVIVADLDNDWVVDLAELNGQQGNFVINSVNKNSRVFREHKKSSDAAHELVRHLATTNDGERNDADCFDAEDFVATAQGKIEEMKLGFLSKRSGLAEDLDVVIFGDLQEGASAAALAAAIEAVKNQKQREEQAKFPSLVQGDEQQQGAASALSAPALLEFVSCEEATRRIVHFARGAGLVVTNQDAAAAASSSSSSSSRVMEPGAKSGDIKIQAGPFRSLWGRHASAAPLSAPVAEIIRRLNTQLAKAAFMRFQSGHTEVRRGIPPTLQLVAKKVHSHWVTSLTGVVVYYFDEKQVLDTLKKKLACSARMEDDVAVAKTQAKNTVSLVLTGRHVEDLLEFLKTECGVDPSFVHVTAPPAKKK